MVFAKDFLMSFCVTPVSQEMSRRVGAQWKVWLWARGDIW